MTISVLPLGDAAFTLAFDGWTEIEGARRISALCDGLLAERVEGGLSGVVDLIPASRSLTVCFDPASVGFEALSAAIAQMARAAGDAPQAEARRWVLPACYDVRYAPDLDEVAQVAGLDADAVIAAHSAASYTVLLIGFLPGFPFLGPLDERLHLPRRAEPRTRVPAGSVAIANDRTAVYPWASPGGWWLIGRCPVPLFDPDWPTPSLLRPGDSVRFAPTPADELARIEAALKAGDLSADRFRDGGAES